MPYFRINGVSKKSGRKMKPRSFISKTEQSAKTRATRDGMKVESIEQIRVEYFQFQIAGTTHNNADGSSRENIVKKLTSGESLIVQFEDGNPYDKHATSILNERGQQIGYVPKDLADIVMEGFYFESGCVYAAKVRNVEPFHGGNRLTATVVLIVAVPDVTKDELTHLISEHLEESPSDFSFAVMETGEYQSRKKASSSLSISASPNRRKKQSGCLLQLLMFLSIVLGACATL